MENRKLYPKGMLHTVFGDYKEHRKKKKEERKAKKKDDKSKKDKK